MIAEAIAAQRRWEALPEAANTREVLREIQRQGYKVSRKLSTIERESEELKNRKLRERQAIMEEHDLDKKNKKIIAYQQRQRKNYNSGNPKYNPYMLQLLEFATTEKRTLREIANEMFRLSGMLPSIDTVWRWKRLYSFETKPDILGKRPDDGLDTWKGEELLKLRLMGAKAQELMEYCKRTWGIDVERARVMEVTTLAKRRAKRAAMGAV